MDSLATSRSPSKLLQLTLMSLALLAGFNAGAESFKASVIGITDGDTVRVLRSSSEQVKIRLSEIDAPEKSQPWGQRSKQTLSDLVYRRTVTVEVVTTDRYGRTVANLILEDGRKANEEMVRSGNAWVYRKYMLDSALLDIEADARRNRRGLWSLTEDRIIPPWDWRSKKR